jgi:hypothetical protein
LLCGKLLGSEYIFIAAFASLKKLKQNKTKTQKKE